MSAGNIVEELQKHLPLGGRDQGHQIAVGTKWSSIKQNVTSSTNLVKFIVFLSLFVVSRELETSVL